MFRVTPRSTKPRVDELKQILIESTKRPETDQSTLLVSVDFGATYTGVAYVFTASPDTINRVTEWPSMSKLAPTPKVPTVLKYEGSTVKWGFEVSPTDPKRIEGFKQLLVPNLPKPLHVTYPKVQSELKAQGKDAFQVTYAYLRALYDYTLPYIEKESTKEYTEVLSIKFVLSFPAEWPASAKKLVQDAAGRAGFAPILEAIEPEAAAAYALSYANLKSAELQVDDIFTLVDAGGGLVDVFSYKILKIQPLLIEKLVPATGGTGGSLMLNKAFEHYMQGVIDEEELMHLKKTAAYSNAMQQFEEKIKPSYSTTGPATYRITFPDARLTPDSSLGLEASAMTISSDSLSRIFQPVVKEIGELVRAQIRSVELKFGNKNDASLVKCIILVGGLGQSKYLKEYITKEFSKFQIIQPEFSNTAVGLGSLMRHLPGRKGASNRLFSSTQGRTRQSRKSAKSYGIQSSPIYDQAKHGDVPKFWDPWESVWRCTDIVWFVSKGDDISRPRTIPLTFHKECEPNPISEASIRFEIRQSSTAQTLGVSSPSSWSERCTEIIVPLMMIPEARFTRKVRKSDGQEYWDLQYSIVVNIEAMILRVWVEVDGTRYGETDFH